MHKTFRANKRTEVGGMCTCVVYRTCSFDVVDWFKGRSQWFAISSWLKQWSSASENLHISLDGRGLVRLYAWDLGMTPQVVIVDVVIVSSYDGVRVLRIVILHVWAWTFDATASIFFIRDKRVKSHMENNLFLLFLMVLETLDGFETSWYAYGCSYVVRLEMQKRVAIWISCN